MRDNLSHPILLKFQIFISKLKKREVFINLPKLIPKFYYKISRNTVKMILTILI